MRHKQFFLIAILAGFFLAVGLLIMRAAWKPAESPQPAPVTSRDIADVEALAELSDENGSGMVLRPAVGLNIDFEGERRLENRIISERYRLFDPTGTYTGEVGQEGVINISSGNATVLLTDPSGQSHDVTNETWYYAHQIFPPLLEGTYRLTIALAVGEEAVFSLPGTRAQETTLQRTEQIRIQQKPELGPESTSSDFLLHEELERFDRESRTQVGFALAGVDLSRAELAYHINNDHVPFGGMLPAANADTHFWLDLEQKRLLDEENEQLIKQVSEYAASLSPEEYEALSEKEKRSLELSMSSLGRELHMFLARVSGKWYYAWAEYPEDFVE